MIKKALIAAAALLALSAHAGYTSLVPPPGYTPGSATARATYAAAATDKAVQDVIRQAGGATATVAGNKVKIDVAYKLAPTASRVAAAAIYLHPGVRTAVTVAGWLVAAKLVWDEASQSWKSQGDDGTTTSHGYEYRAHSPGALWRPTAELACKDWVNVLSQTWAGSYVYTSSVPMSDGTCALAWHSVRGGNSGTEYQGYEIKFSQCPTGWTATPAGCLSPALTQPQFEEELIKAPMPSSVPLELPYPTPLPIERPSPWINPTPGENPQSQPLRVPTGQPVPIPNTDPQQYRHPHVDIVPAPTPDNPWRVDVKPGETINTNPNPAENPQPDPQEEPAEEEDKSLCDKHPEIAACEKVEVTDKPLPDQPKLYEPKYPDGISGVWNSKIQEIKATPLFNLAPSLLPTVSGGSCPSWKVDLSIDGWTNAGLQDVSPPCWVWDVAKLIIIASALLLARRLIFGG